MAEPLVPWVQGAPRMHQKVRLDAFVNGYSTNQVGENPHPIVSLFVPDGGNDWHDGPTGITIWIARERFDDLMKEQDDLRQAARDA